MRDELMRLEAERTTEELLLRNKTRATIIEKSLHELSEREPELMLGDIIVKANQIIDELKLVEGRRSS